MRDPTGSSASCTFQFPALSSTSIAASRLIAERVSSAIIEPSYHRGTTMRLLLTITTITVVPSMLVEGEVGAVAGHCLHQVLAAAVVKLVAIASTTAIFVTAREPKLAR